MKEAPRRSKLGWYDPIDRLLERFLNVYMPLEVWGLGIVVVVMLLIWLGKVVF